MNSVSMHSKRDPYKIKKLQHTTRKMEKTDELFLIGDLIEVMYFAAKSPQERNEWMEAFRMAAIDKGNELLLKHHPGVYGLTNKDRWSCCGRARRECEGCADSRGALKMLGW
uniref:PH domain-containing protein n=1 Tax=Amphimedon queenslandica TaxID=400682 RepID=A0A1X7T040_AMPQE